MLSHHEDQEQGGGNLPFGSTTGSQAGLYEEIRRKKKKPFEKTLTTRGYWRRTEEDVQRAATRVFGLDSDQAQKTTEKFATLR